MAAVTVSAPEITACSEVGQLVGNGGGGTVLVAKMTACTNTTGPCYISAADAFATE